jgi:hypothetical protein
VDFLRNCLQSSLDIDVAEKVGESILTVRTSHSKAIHVNYFAAIQRPQLGPRRY